MLINGTEFNAYQLRFRQGKWYFDLWNLGKDTGMSYGPFTYYDAEAWIDAHPELVDWDRETTRQKLKAESNK